MSVTSVFQTCHERVRKMIQTLCSLCTSRHSRQLRVHPARPHLLRSDYSFMSRGRVLYLWTDHLTPQVCSERRKASDGPQSLLWLPLKTVVSVHQTENPSGPGAVIGSITATTCEWHTLTYSCRHSLRLQLSFNHFQFVCVNLNSVISTSALKIQIHLFLDWVNVNQLKWNYSSWDHDPLLIIQKHDSWWTPRTSQDSLRSRRRRHKHFIIDLNSSLTNVL